MKTAEEYAESVHVICEDYRTDPCPDICRCAHTLTAIRAAQREAAEWMREEAAKVAEKSTEADPDDVASDRHFKDGRRWAALRIRAIKLPGEAA